MRDEVKSAIEDALCAEIGDAYDCTRVWEAWSVGTMGQHDFVPLSDRGGDITDSIYIAVSGVLRAQQADSAARIAELERQLTAMTADRNLWQEQHNGDCPNLARVTELERRCLIAELAIGDACKWLDMAGTEHIVLQRTERQLIAEGKLPQIEVKP